MIKTMTMTAAMTDAMKVAGVAAVEVGVAATVAAAATEGGPGAGAAVKRPTPAFSPRLHDSGHTKEATRTSRGPLPPSLAHCRCYTKGFFASSELPTGAGS